MSPDPEVQETIQKIGPTRPANGTRRMAAQASGELNRPVNGKAVRRIFKGLGWSEHSRTKRQIIRTSKKPPGPKAPNQFWESDASYIWCGSYDWGLLLQRDRRLHRVVDGARAGRPSHAPRGHHVGDQRGGRRRSGTARPDTLGRQWIPVHRPRIQIIYGGAGNHPPPNTSTSTRQSRTDTLSPFTQDAQKRVRLAAGVCRHPRSQRGDACSV